MISFLMIYMVFHIFFDLYQKISVESCLVECEVFCQTAALPSSLSICLNFYNFFQYRSVIQVVPSSTSSCKRHVPPCLFMAKSLKSLFYIRYKLLSPQQLLVAMPQQDSRARIVIRKYHLCESKLRKSGFFFTMLLSFVAKENKACAGEKYACHCVSSFLELVIS